MKILFLDIDGVLNSEATLHKSHRGVIGIDPFLFILLDRIIQATGASIVLSSSWRHSPQGREEVKKAGIDFVDYTPSCCTGIRGAEIYSWITKNIAYEAREHMRYAILDDESDMLLWQKDHFFQTTFKDGLTQEIADKVIAHLNRES